MTTLKTTVKEERCVTTLKTAAKETRLVRIVKGPCGP